MSKHRAERLARIRAKLESAMAQHTCLELDMPDEAVTGYCVGVGRRWCLVQTSAPWPDGYVAVRIADLERIRHHQYPTIHRFAFEHEGAWPPSGLDGLDLDTTETLVAGLAERYPLLGLELRDSDDQLFVGAPVLVAQGTLMLQELTPSPTWEALSTWRLGDLARITVGGRYQDLLDLAAPERPADPSPFAG